MNLDSLIPTIGEWLRGTGPEADIVVSTRIRLARNLAAFPFTSGFFSKDEIMAYASARGGMYLIFTVLGYFGALLTAIYTFRLIFRILPGQPCKEAQELMDTGHVAHEEPRNPATGGVGLGLTIARDVVRSHGGDIILSDSPLGGLRARIRLPV